MSELNIGRIQIALHGIPAPVAEQAVTGLDDELRHRFTMLQIDGMAGIDLGELSLSPVHSSTVLDANALRGLIADRLNDAIMLRLNMGEGN
jgi:Mrp family chromosome partitioning ATPase